MKSRALCAFVFPLLLLLSGPGAFAEGEKPVVVEAGRKVSMEYTLKLDDGTVVDTNVGGEPLVYRHGQAQILPALEQSLSGLQVHDTKSVTLSPQQGYGAVDASAVQTVALELVPEEARKVGTQLVSEGPDGRRRLVRVKEIREAEAVLDLNHPLAGKTLHFDLRIVGVE